ncbi:MAG TPA: hypothetical protein VID49_05175 [Steroidobacteraceae bacterium]
MTTRCTHTRSVAATAVAVLGLAGEARAAGYIAAPPPQAVRLNGVGRGEHYDVFLSKRPVAEIRALYAARDKPGFSNQADGPVILSYQQVVDILLARHGDVTLADDLRVSIKWQTAAAGEVHCAGEFFQQLLVIAQMQKRQAEFDALCRQYGYLQHAFFQRLPDPAHPGHWVAADKEILAHAHRANGGQQTQGLAAGSAQTAQRIEALALSGHADQVAALTAQLNQQALQASAGLTDWNAWVRALKDGDAQAYRTWVVLPTHPSGW